MSQKNESIGVWTKHPDYICYLNRLQKNRDAFSGQDAIKENFDIYFAKTPALHKMRANSMPFYNNLGDKVIPTTPNSNYQAIANAYKEFGVYENLTGKTASSMIAMIMRIDPDLQNLPSRLEYVSKNIDGLGNDISSFVKKCIEEILITNNAICLISFDSDGLHKCTLHKIEDVYNYKEYYDANGNKKYRSIMIREKAFTDDDYSHDYNYTALKLAIDMSNGYFYYERYKTDGELILDENGKGRIYPVVSGKYLTEIPIVAMNKNGFGITYKDAILSSVADVNIGMWNDDCKLRTGLAQTASPTFYGLGFSQEEASRVTLGAFGGITSENTDAKVGLLEFSGAGLGLLKASIDEGRKSIGRLGLSFVGLDNGSNVAETMGALKIKNAGDFGILASIANVLSNGITRALKVMASGKIDPLDDQEGDDIVLTVNNEFIPDGVDPALVVSLWNTCVMGGLSFDSYYNALDEMNFYPHGWDIEKERAAIEGTAMAMPMPIQEPAKEKEEPEEKEVEVDDRVES